MSEASQATPSHDDAYRSPPIERAIRLLRRIAQGDTVTNMSETARNIGINRTTLIRLLHTLEVERFIERNERNEWKIGLGFIALAAPAFSSDNLLETAAPVLSRLAENLGLSAHLGVLDGREIVYLLRRLPNQVFASNIQVGSRLPAHAANMGRIILAHLSPDKVDRIFAGAELRAVTPHTATTLLRLHAQIDADRKAGLAWSDGNFEAGISSVAAAIFDRLGAPVAAINVSGHPSQFGNDARREHIGTAVRSAAFEISQRLGWHPPAARLERDGLPAHRPVPSQI